MEDTRPVYYNGELKKRYLETKAQDVVIPTNYIEVQFRKTAEMEFELSKDVSNWTFYEIIEFYKILNTTSFETLLNLNNILALYTQFCIENSLVKDNQNHFLECTQERLMGCLNKIVFDRKIVDRETILSWVKELPNPKDQFILLGLFEFGKSKDFKDLVYAKPSDVCGNTLKLSDRTVSISNELVTIIRNCIEEETYYSITGKGEKKVALEYHGYIIKSYPNQNINMGDYQKGRNIYASCQRAFQYLGVEEWMTPNAVVESGKLYMIKEMAKKMNMSTMDFFYSKGIKEVEKQFGCMIVRSVYMKKYAEYLK